MSVDIRLLLSLSGCASAPDSTGPLLLAPPTPGWELESPDFASGGDLPDAHTCDGEGVSPALRWGEPPAGTAALALLLTDPDSHRGRWAHWLLLDIPAGERAIPRGAQAGVPGLNDDNWLGYSRPCPRPDGAEHTLYFELYALETPTGLPRSASMEQVIPALEGRAFAVATFTAHTSRGTP